VITIETHPPRVLLAGNPARFNISSDNAISTPGVKARLRLQITGINTTAEYEFRISYGSKDLDFVLKTSLSDDPLDVPVGLITDTIFTWTQKIYEAFLANYDLNHYFDITLWDFNLGLAGINITAKTEGVDYTMVFDNNGDITEISQFSNVAGVDEVYRTGFGILMNLWSEDLTELMAEDLKNVDSSGYVQFNVSEILLAELAMDDTTRFLFPETGSTNAIYRSSFILSFIAAFAERYDESVRKFVFDEEIRYALAGGLSRESLVFYNNIESDYFAPLKNQKRFLTWAPIEKTTGVSSVEKLFFCLLNTGSTCRLSARVTFTDDTYTDIDVTALASYAACPVSVMECCVGYAYLRLSTLSPGKTVNYWQVWIENSGGTILSEIRKFTLDTKYQENERQLLFRNSLSAYDTIRITGIRENNNEYQRQTAAQFLNEPESFLNAPEKSYSNEEKAAFKASTGWLTLDEKDWLRDLLLSREVYEISARELIPVSIVSKKAFILKDKETLYSLEFEYEKAFTDQYYSIGKNINSDSSVKMITADNDEITADSDVITADQLIY
jgi:hypothetical protein